MMDDLPRELAVAEAEEAIANVQRKIRDVRKAKKAKHDDMLTRRRPRSSPKK